MATRKSTKKRRAGMVPGEEDIARVYEAAGHDSPPPALDARILVEAQRAVSDSKRPLPFHRRWLRPLSTAAIVVLAVGVVLLMTREGALNHRTEIETPGEYVPAPAAAPPPTAAVTAEQAAPASLPASPPPLADVREEKRAAEPAKTKPAAEELAKPKATPAGKAADRKMAKQVPAVAAPEATGPAAEADQPQLARKEQAPIESVPAGVPAMTTQGANVTGVVVNGSPGAYSFNVTVKSPDTGCRQYADWWEVLSEDGKLLYRRVLFHSHVGEQPFTRSGGPVPIQPDAVVWVRAHMNTSGYGGVVFKGSVKAGFKPAALDAGFAAGVAKQSPLPDGCAF